MASLETTLVTLAKKYGAGIVRSASEIEEAFKVPIGIPIVDYVTTGGFPVGRITEIYGPFSSCKSYAVYKGIAAFQKVDWANMKVNAVESITYKVKKSRSKDEAMEGFSFSEVAKVKYRRYKQEYEPEIKRVVLVDIEGTYDREWGSKLGIDNDGLIYVNPSSLNQAIDMIDAFLSDESISLVVIDSMIAMGCDAETDSSMENEQMAVNARFWNKATRKIQAAMNRNTNEVVSVIAINGSYEKVGIAFGDPEKIKNGANFSLAKSISLKFSALKDIKAKVDDVEQVVGKNIVVRNKKNKVGRPYLDGTFYYSLVDDGYLKAGETDVVQQLIDLGIRFKVIDKSAATYTYGDLKVRGAEQLRNALIEKDLLGQLQQEVYKHF